MKQYNDHSADLNQALFHLCNLLIQCLKFRFNFFVVAFRELAGQFIHAFFKFLAVHTIPMTTSSDGIANNQEVFSPLWAPKNLLCSPIERICVGLVRGSGIVGLLEEFQVTEEGKPYA